MAKTTPVPDTPVRRKTDAERRDDRIPVRVTAVQKAVLTEGAALAGLDVSSWLRSLGMKEAATHDITEASVKIPQPQEKDAAGSAPNGKPKAKVRARTKVRTKR